MSNLLQARSQVELSRIEKLIRIFWMSTATIGAIVIIVLLMRPRGSHSNHGIEANKAVGSSPRVRAVEPGIIEIAADTPLHKELARLTVVSEKISLPLLSVGGTVVARIRKGSEPMEDRWQFDRPELSTSYADWLRATNEIDFAESQLSKTKALADAETSYLKTNLQRFESLTDGSIPEKDLRQARSALLKSQLQGDKDVFAAQSALRAALKQKAAIERDLAQAGIEPSAFARAAENMVLVVANVPEAKAAQVSIDQACEVHFYVYPGRTFPGHVEAISSVLTQERRTLRVLFDLTDEQHLLKPGMFAEVGLGTEPREAIMIPATALLHIGRSDYVLVNSSENRWRATEVKVGEVRHERCEVLSGLAPGQIIIIRGAILLKSVAAQALTMPIPVVEKS